MILIVGEILFDKFPGYKRLGGAPFNYYYHLRSLGLSAIFVGRIGRDRDGEEILLRFAKSGFDASGLQIDDQYGTGTVNVSLDSGGSHAFEIVPDVAYDHISLSDALNVINFDRVKLIYFGTLIQRTLNGFHLIHQLTSETRAFTKSLCDLNLRPHCYSEKTVTDSLHRTDFLKLNIDEFQYLKDLYVYNDSNQSFIKYLKNRFMLEWICVTKGGSGSELHIGETVVKAPTKDPRNVIDTVGAGDAFSAILTIGYLKSWEPNLILERATEFALAICNIKGAIPDSSSFYDRFLPWMKG